MNILYRLNNKLPPLAWAAYCNNGDIEVIHGNRVECTDDFFVEGAWDGEFEKGSFETAEWFCGTGGHMYQEKIVFSTPTHVVGGLYFVEVPRGEGYYVSNSLYLLMALNEYQIDPQYLNYEVDFNTILLGIHDYKNKIHSLNNQGNKVNIDVVYFRNIEIDNKNKMSVCIKSLAKPFSDFDDYFSRMLNAISKLGRNAQNKSRFWQYGMVTTISKGYDAPCCAVVAKQVGCDTAVTFKAEGKYKDDCGTEIAQILGYKNIIEKDALEYLKRSDCVEAFYIASGELGAQISFCAFDEDFAGKVVFTGERGDSVWGRNSKNRNNHFSFDDMLSHLGSVERRLWLGYISVPMPLYGASAWESIYEISNSVEMKKWTLENGYDRPIPRRIIEEAGVSRELFGMDKHGAGFVYRYDWMRRILSKMSKIAGMDFKCYVKKYKKFHLIKFLLYFWNTKEIYLSRLGFKVKKRNLVEYSQIANPTVVRYMIPWAGNYVLEKYKLILGVK